MPRKLKAQRPGLSEALVQLRWRLDDTQSTMARRLMVSLETVALWETKRPPKGLILLRLAKLARECGRLDLLQIFMDAAENGGRRAAEQLREEQRLWNDLFARLKEIRLDPAAGERISQLALEAEKWANEAQDRSWRNQVRY